MSKYFFEPGEYIRCRIPMIDHPTIKPGDTFLVVSVETPISTPMSTWKIYTIERNGQQYIVENGYYHFDALMDEQPVWVMTWATKDGETLEVMGLGHDAEDAVKRAAHTLATYPDAPIVDLSNQAQLAAQQSARLW